ncbi:hypothetical protein TSUD_235610 [Trifolium subterraneum]|nr:hypothetical protein TSUD_235610 [Trifolium subterraneum]
MMPMWMDGVILIGVARPYILLLEIKQSGKYKTYQMNFLVTNDLIDLPLPGLGSIADISPLLPKLDDREMVKDPGVLDVVTKLDKACTEAGPLVQYLKVVRVAQKRPNIFNRERPLFLKVLCGLEHVRQGEIVSRLYKLKIPGS